MRTEWHMHLSVKECNTNAARTARCSLKAIHTSVSVMIFMSSISVWNDCKLYQSLTWAIIQTSNVDAKDPQCFQYLLFKIYSKSEHNHSLYSCYLHFQQSTAMKSGQISQGSEPTDEGEINSTHFLFPLNTGHTNFPFFLWKHQTKIVHRHSHIYFFSDKIYSYNNVHKSTKITLYPDCSVTRKASAPKSKLPQTWGIEVPLVKNL